MEANELPYFLQELMASVDRDGGKNTLLDGVLHETLIKVGGTINAQWY